MLAKLILIGNLGHDAEVRYTPSGKQVTNFSLATNRHFKTGDGEKKDETTWFRVNAWGKLGEITQNLTKGQKLYIEGRLSPEIRVWKDNDGNHRATYEVTLERLVFLTPKPGGASSEPIPDDEDDLPF
jgi:single-strand DNA-binding protein